MNKKFLTWKQKFLKDFKKEFPDMKPPRLTMTRGEYRVEWLNGVFKKRK